MKHLLYWLIPIVLFALQSVYTFQTLNQIRYEELAESVRNVWWFKHRMIYDGQSSNVGWFSLMLLIYELFGFHLFAGKFVRLGLQLVSLVCLAAILKKYLGEKRALLPLFTIGLSPTLLYFNTIQTTYGMDLQFLPICLYLLTTLNFKRKWHLFITQVLLWGTAMVAWMSYPTFLYYLPAIGFWYFRTLRSSFPIKQILISVASFLLPLLTVLLYVENRDLLIYDSAVHSGIFRGAGTLVFEVGVFLYNLRMNLQNLFLQPFGYYYELRKVDFSDFYPLATVFFVIYAAVCLLRNKAYRLWVLLPFLVILTNMLVAYFTVDPTPGLRRYTGTLAALYALFAWSWYFALSKRWRRSALRWIAIASLLLLPIHHLLVYSINLSHLKDPSNFAESLWFAQADSPVKSLSLLVDRVKRGDAQLLCLTNEQKPADCRYSEIYAAVAGSCHWSKLQCGKLLANDPKTKQFIPLSLDIWTTYYFAH